MKTFYLFEMNRKNLQIYEKNPQYHQNITESESDFFCLDRPIVYAFSFIGNKFTINFNYVKFTFNFLFSFSYEIATEIRISDV